MHPISSFCRGLRLPILLIWLNTLTVHGQTTPPVLNPAKLDQFLTQLMDSARIPGLSIALIRDNKVVYSKGYGLTKADSTQQVTSSTIFEAASLSKPVFAYAVLQLVEEGLLNLDKPLYEYLPYPDVATDERYQKITARLVLSHRSGFPNWRKREPHRSWPCRLLPANALGIRAKGSFICKK